MHKKLLLSIIATALVFVQFSCKKSSTTPVSTLIANVWYAKKVMEGSATVYDKSSTTNTKSGYANYKLNLTTAPTAVLTEFDGNTFTGKYSVVSDKTLSLTGLTPAPTGTAGSISYTITSISATDMVLTADQVSVKTGNTTNVYTLSTTK